MSANVREETRFPLGSRQALNWAINTCARIGYVAPSIARMMGGGHRTDERMTMLEQHGDAAYIIGILNRLPEPYQDVILLRSAVLPDRCNPYIAHSLAPYIIRQMGPGITNRRAVEAAILRTTGKGPGIRPIREELKIRTRDASDWARIVADKVDTLGKIAEAEFDRILSAKGWI